MHYEHALPVPSLEENRTADKNRRLSGIGSRTVRQRLIGRGWPNCRTYVVTGLTTLTVFALAVSGVALFLLQLADHGW